MSFWFRPSAASDSADTAAPSVSTDHPPAASVAASTSTTTTTNIIMPFPSLTNDQPPRSRSNSASGTGTGRSNSSEKTNSALATLTKIRDSALELVSPHLLTQKQTQPKYYHTTGKPVCGTGSFGEVVRVPDLNDPTRTVAVKTIKSQIARQQPHYCLYLYRELYMLRNMSHPNIISLLDVKAPKFDPNNVEQVEAGGLDGSLDTLQLVFECADYDLSKYLTLRRRSRQPLSEFEVQYLLFQLLQATKYIHSANIIHRDIKPENLLIWTNSLTLKLTDFGLARIVTPSSPPVPYTPTTTDMSFFDSSAHPEIAPANGMDIEIGCISSSALSGSGEAADYLSRTRSDSVSSTSSQRDSFTCLLQTKQQQQLFQQQQQQQPLAAQTEQNPSTALPDYMCAPPPPLTRNLTQHVVSRWYRAPEIILVQQYHTAIDVWSIGCVFGDLLSCGKPLFPGSAVAPLSLESMKEGQKGEDSNMLSVIFHTLGGPTEEDIRSFPEETVQTRLKKYQGLEADQSLTEKFPAASPVALSLLYSMIAFTVERRITVDASLAHGYFESVADLLRENTKEMSRGLVMNIVPKKRDVKQKKELCQKIMEEVNYYTRKYSSPSSIQSPSTRSNSILEEVVSEEEEDYFKV